MPTGAPPFRRCTPNPNPASPERAPASSAGNDSPIVARGFAFRPRRRTAAIAHHGVDEKRLLWSASEPEFWLKMQVQYDLWQARKKVPKVRRFPHAANR